MKKIINEVILGLLLFETGALASEVKSYTKNISNQNKPSNIYNGTKKLDVEQFKKLRAPSIINDSTQISFNPFMVKSIEVILDEEIKSNIPEISQYNGKLIDSENMKELLNKVTRHFLKEDYLLPKVSLSNLALKDGRIKIKVEPLALDDVVILGEAEDNELVKEYAKKIMIDVPTKLSKVQRYLALMNDLPGVDIQYRLKENEGKAELVIYTIRKKGAVYVGIDSHGSASLGKYHTSALVQAYAPFNKNESIVVHGGMTNHPNRYNDYGVNFFVPINSEGSKLHLSAFHTQDNPSKKDTVEAKTNQGNNYRMALTHHILIGAHLDLEAEAGLIHKNIKLHQQVNNESVRSKESKFWIGDLGFKYLFKDRFDAKNMFTIAYIQGLNGKFKNYLSGDQVDKKFSMGRFNFFRELDLNNNFEIFSHLCLSYSNSKAPDSEKSTLGGRDFGRGYSSAVIDGTKLAAFAAELRYNINLKDEDVIHRMQPYIFHDIGSLGTQGPNTHINKVESAGLGLRFKIKYGIESGFEAAFPFKRNYIVDGNNYKAATNYSFFVNKIMEF